VSFLRKISISVIAATATFGLSAAKSQELVTNGTFTRCTGLTCSGWILQTNLGTFYNYFAGNAFHNGYNTAHGVGATLSQNIATTVGKTYQINYAARLFHSGTPYLLRSSFGGTVLANNFNSGLTTSTTSFAYTAKASSSNSVLEFFGYNNPDEWILSDVSVTLLYTGLAYSSTLQPYADMQSIGLDALKNQRELVLNQAGDCDQRGWVVYDSNKTKTTSKTKKNQSLCIFAEGGNANGTINGTGSLGGYNTANASSAYGLEWKASKQWTIGAAYGYGSTNLSNFNFQDTSATIGSTINSGALYGVYRPDKPQRWKIAGLFGYSGFSYTGSRSYLGDVATSAYNASGYTGALQASYDIPLTTDYNGEKNRLSPIRIKPMLGLAYGSQQQDGFSESGAGTLVNVQGQTTNSLLGSVGVSLEAPIALNQKKTTVLIPRIGVAYQYDFLADQDGNRSITAAVQDDATTSYTVQGQTRGSSNLQLNLGADLQLNPKTVLYAGVNYQAFNNGDQFGYQGGLRYKF